MQIHFRTLRDSDSTKSCLWATRTSLRSKVETPFRLCSTAADDSETVALTPWTH
jgi:hypothetical protein